MNTDLLKLKVKRFTRRRTNTLVEQILKALRKLEASLEAIDKEQDEANRMLDEQIAGIEQAKKQKEDDLRAQLAMLEEVADTQRLLAMNKFTPIIESAKLERETVVRIRDQVRVLVPEETE